MATTLSSVVRRAAIGAAAVGIAVAGFPDAALAAGASAHCNVKACAVTAKNFPGGRAMYVDVDVTGSAGTVGTVQVWKLNGTGFQCEFTIPASDPIKSYKCGTKNGTAGNYQGLIEGQSDPSAIGIRW